MLAFEILILGNSVLVKLEFHKKARFAKILSGLKFKYHLENMYVSVFTSSFFKSCFSNGCLENDDVNRISYSRYSILSDLIENPLIIQQPRPDPVSGA